MIQTTEKLPREIQNSMKEVTVKQILTLRLSGKKFILIKTQNKYYVLVQSNGIERIIREAFDAHKCSTCANFCKNGELCPKVKDISLEVCRKYTCTEMDALVDSKRIEKYSFISEGVELINSPREFFIVSVCKNYKDDTKQRKENEEMWEKNTEEFFEAKTRECFRKRNYGSYPRKLY